ncbi:hypothetical protein K461DRAFT_297450 [Myriangium duriaei CBS 260.36]|uniref:Gamma interferon inducible lysosomal thiol reductase GILT n=1 Tax=Myriangium duriaei CBS 260.36 TaxID=1168546 RepID=A0A9P4MIP3_9PEZI|nr:hypothetical protein K461DRAFT_297450 [Myriangium duriaei CBS 260.36]
MADYEKAPLLPASQHDDDQSLEERVKILKDKEEEARLAWIDAGSAHMEAWWRTSKGRTMKRVQRIVIGTMSAISMGLMGLVLYAIADMIVHPGTDWTFPKRIPLEAHIMSKCPDAKDCLNDLVLPAMMEVSHLVDFKLSYIGTPTEQDDGVLCKHGPGECLGNILELCAADLYPDPKIYLGFTMCMTRQYSDIPSRSLVKDCALEHGISFDALNDCASDDHLGKGMDLLRTSVERSHNASVGTSCTVRLDDKVWCVRDDGEWKDCPGGTKVKDLVGEVKKLWNATMYNFEH